MTVYVLFFFITISGKTCKENMKKKRKEESANNKSNQNGDGGFKPNKNTERHQQKA